MKAQNSIEELLKQKLEKRKTQQEKDKTGYDAGWIDGLKWALDEIQKENRKAKK